MRTGRNLIQLAHSLVRINIFPGQAKLVEYRDIHVPQLLGKNKPVYSNCWTFLDALQYLTLQIFKKSMKEKKWSKLTFRYRRKQYQNCIRNYILRSWSGIGRGRIVQRIKKKVLVCIMLKGVLLKQIT